MGTCSPDTSSRSAATTAAAQSGYRKFATSSSPLLASDGHLTTHEPVDETA
jgi:hypothetical protein